MPKIVRQVLSRADVESAKPKDIRYRLWDAKVPGLCLRVTPNATKSWELHFSRGSARQLGRFPAMTLEHARSKALQQLGNFQRDGSISKRDAPDSLKGFLAGRYGEWSKAFHKRGEANLKAIENTFPDFLKLRLVDITVSRAERWSAGRVADGISPATVNRDLIRLKGLLTKAVEWELLQVSPLKGLKLAKIDSTGVVRYLSDAERKRLNEQLDKRDGYIVPLVKTALGTGLRRGELTSITWADVDFDLAQITVRAGYAKSRKARRVPLNSSVVAALKAWKKSSRRREGLVFPVVDPKKAWATLLTDAKIKDFRFHDTRHDFASRLAMSGVDLYTISELLGHADLTMTKRYAHLAPEHKSAAVEKLVS
jgi:integrase